MENQYIFANRMSNLYGLLEDEHSKKIFWARLQYDCERSLENEARLFQLTGYATKEELKLREQLPGISLRLKEAGKKLFLYGASTNGQVIGSMLLRNGDFFAYCARNPGKYPNGVHEKPVYSPNYVFQHPEDCYVLISAIATMEDIYNILMEHGFPGDHIFRLTNTGTNEGLVKRQYFDFPELFPRGKAFVDGGCFDCETSKRFAEWCGDDYSKIFAFEPDPKNYQKCLAISDQSKLRLELMPFGLSERAETVRFAENGTGGSFMLGPKLEDEKNSFNTNRGKTVTNEITIQTVALDDVVGDTEIGFIKMDIEGAELGALHGAEQTILRDKPLLAICVYHRCGDVLAIMDYLHHLVPQYRFWLRQYSAVGTETVLYASV